MTQSAEIHPEPKLLVRALRVELAKPLSLDWDELGLILRTQRTVMGRLMQAGVDTVVACKIAGTDAVKAAVSPDARAEQPMGLAYQGVLRELEKIREGKWSPEQLAALDIHPAAVLAGISKRAHAEYSAWQSAQYKPRVLGQGKKGRASYGRMQPIAVHCDHWTLHRGSRGFELTFAVVRGQKITVALAPSRGRHWATLGGIASDEIAHGDLKLIYDERRKKWYALIAYKAPPESHPELDVNKVLAVHRGKYNMLTAMDLDGHWKVMAAGHKLLNMKRHLKARRWQSKRLAEAERGDGACGHGSSRRYELPEALAEKEKRYINTLCQQLGAGVIRLAKHWGCGTILIEQYGGQDVSDDRGERRFIDTFPWHRLKESIAWSVKKTGLVLAECPAEYISSECPECGNRDTSQHNHHGIFHCKKCDFERAADFVAPLHMLRRFVGHAGEHDKRIKEVGRIAAGLKKGRNKKKRNKH